jgi:hypothetical protein
MDKIREFKDECMIIRIRPESVGIRGSLLEAVRRCWRANLQRAQKSEYVLAIISTIDDGDLEVKGVFKPECWDYLDDGFCREKEQECKEKYDVKTERCAERKRIAFTGEEIKDDVKYLHKLIPDKYFPTQNPFRYTY